MGVTTKYALYSGSPSWCTSCVLSHPTKTRSHNLHRYFSPLGSLCFAVVTPSSASRHVQHRAAIDTLTNRGATHALHTMLMLAEGEVVFARRGSPMHASRARWKFCEHTSCEHFAAMTLMHSYIMLPYSRKSDLVGKYKSSACCVRTYMTAVPSIHAAWLRVRLASGIL